MPKRNSEPDFKKVKQKVGQKKIDPKATNVNVRMKRIRVQEQSIMRDDQEMVNYRNKSLADLVGQFTHYNAGVRREAILGLRDLFSQNEILYSTSLNVLITKTIPLILDSDVSVRQAVVNIYGSMLENVPRNALLPFSSVISLFINNGLTSINPAIRRSSLLMVQTILEIEPELFSDSAIKILSSMIKLTTEVKASSVPTHGVLSATRTQIKSNSKEQRPITELALETIQVFFTSCFSSHNIYTAITTWSGCQDDYEETMEEFTKQTLSLPLVLPIADTSSFFSTHEVTTSSTSLIQDSVQTLLGLLFSSIAELVPPADEKSLSLHLLPEEETLRSKSISEKHLHRLALLLELVANSLLMLESEGVTGLKEKSEQDWCTLLKDFYPLRLPDSHRNETPLRLKLQKVNHLLIHIMSMLIQTENKSCELIRSELQQDVLFITSARKPTQGSSKGYEILPETLVLRMSTIHRLWRVVEDKEELIQYVVKNWRELIEKKAAAMSLPFMQFFRFVLNQHQQIEYSSCLQYAIQTLQNCEFNAERNSTCYLWRTGLRLILGVLKSLPSIDDRVRVEFERIVVSAEKESSIYYQLPLDLQSTVLAILSYCGNVSPKVIEMIPEIKSIIRFSS